MIEWQMKKMTYIQQNRCLEYWKWSRGVYIDMWDMATKSTIYKTIGKLESLEKRLLHSWKSSSGWYDTSLPPYVHILMMTLIWNKTNNKNLLINTMWIGMDDGIPTSTIHPHCISCHVWSPSKEFVSLYHNQHKYRKNGIEITHVLHDYSLPPNWLTTTTSDGYI
jgi:hypothetical protein